MMLSESRLSTGCLSSLIMSEVVSEVLDALMGRRCGSSEVSKSQLATLFRPRSASRSTLAKVRIAWPSWLRAASVVAESSVWNVYMR